MRARLVVGAAPRLDAAAGLLVRAGPSWQADRVGSEFAGGAPGTRPDPAAIDRILHAYRESQVLITAVRLGLFDAFAPAAPVASAALGASGTSAESGASGGTEEGVPLAVIAAAGQIPPESCAVLVDGLVGLGLLAEAAAGFALTPLARAHLAPGAPYSLREWVASEQEKYVGFAGLVDALRAAPGPDAPVGAERRRRGLPPEQLQGLAEVARARSVETARVVAGLVDVPGGRPGRILDAGGGHGMDAVGVVAALPGWTAVVGDRPGPLAMAGANATRYGVADRVATTELDLEADDLVAATGGDFDVAFLFMVLGGKPAPEALAVLRRVYDALRPGGWLLVRGNWTDRLRAATSALKHMLRPGGRRTLTHEALLTLLVEAGFADAHTVELDGVAPNAVVAARRPL